MSAGERSTRRQIFAYAALVVLSTALPPVLGVGGLIYAAAAAIGGALFLFAAWRLLVADAHSLTMRARRLFSASILYLFALFAALLAERLLGMAPLAA